MRVQFAENFRNSIFHQLFHIDGIDILFVDNVEDGIDFISTGINMSLSLRQSKVMIPYKDPESNT